MFLAAVLFMDFGYVVRIVVINPVVGPFYKVRKSRRDTCFFAKFTTGGGDYILAFLYAALGHLPCAGDIVALADKDFALVVYQHNTYIRAVGFGIVRIRICICGKCHFKSSFSGSKFWQ